VLLVLPLHLASPIVVKVVYRELMYGKGLKNSKGGVSK